jgi:hypothetical protein
LNVEREEKCLGIIREPKGRRPLGKPGCKWKRIINMDLKQQKVMAWTGYVWLRIGTSTGRNLWNR